MCVCKITDRQEGREGGTDCIEVGKQNSIFSHHFKLHGNMPIKLFHDQPTNQADIKNVCSFRQLKRNVHIIRVDNTIHPA